MAQLKNELESQLTTMEKKFQAHKMIEDVLKGAALEIARIAHEYRYVGYFIPEDQVGTIKGLYCYMSDEELLPFARAGHLISESVAEFLVPRIRKAGYFSDNVYEERKKIGNFFNYWRIWRKIIQTPGLSMTEIKSIQAYEPNTDVVPWREEEEERIHYQPKEKWDDPVLPDMPSVAEIIKATGGITCASRHLALFEQRGWIKKAEDGSLIVSLRICLKYGACCICGLTSTVEGLESLVRDLLRHYEADKIILVNNRVGLESAYPVVKPGTTGDIWELQHAHKGDSWCGTYPLIEGINMSWVSKEEGEY